MTEYTDDKLIDEIKEILQINSGEPNCSTYQNLRKIHAKLLLLKRNYYEAAYNLTECLASSIRTMAKFQFEKTFCDSDKQKHLEIYSHELNLALKNSNIILNQSDNFLKYLQTENVKMQSDIKNPNIFCNYNCDFFLNINHIKHINNDNEELNNMKRNIQELPNEWTIIQLTSGYEVNDSWQNVQYIKKSVKEFYMTVLKNQYIELFNIEPFTIKISPEQTKIGEIPLFEELHSTIQENLHVIEKKLLNATGALSKYWEHRNDCDLRMKSLVSSMNKNWLSNWRCLLLGKIKCNIVNQSINSLIKNIISENRFILSPIQNFLLYSLFNATHYISPNEASLFLCKIYMNYAPHSEKCNKCQKQKKINNFCINCEYKQIFTSKEYTTFRKVFMAAFDSIKSEKILKDLKNTPRGPVILLLDEKLDIFPWEILPIFLNQSVTRMESLRFTYALYKKHEKSIIDGYYQLKPSEGRFLLNLDGDLKKMEKRIFSFIDYWCPEWKGEKNVKPSVDLYEKYLQESDVFLYCGHGNGTQYAGGAGEKLKNVKAVAILSGCGSVSLNYSGPKFLPAPIYSCFHLANCPAVIGMLWEVTDLEIDKVTSTLISLFIPSKASKHWSNVDKSQWSQGIIDSKISNSKIGDYEMEPDLLKAVGIARRFTKYVMIAASVVARGLPVQIHFNYK